MFLIRTVFWLAVLSLAIPAQGPGAGSVSSGVSDATLAAGDRAAGPHDSIAPTGI
ncbi:hypothetical protein [Chthonobacter albigriseus]|uniref:hypothetical protein n=1 Tax=Chthonobacter albigriseus TaxID=1683161 RepID=UPI0015EFA74F|nr:hypothetical protein [Chthonobacter albigriseus]